MLPEANAPPAMHSRDVISLFDAPLGPQCHGPYARSAQCCALFEQPPASDLPRATASAKMFPKSPALLSFALVTAVSYRAFG